MPNIKIPYFQQPDFLKFIKQYAKNVVNYSVLIESDNKIILCPDIGTYTVEYEGNIYNINCLEEGKPIGDLPKYYTRLTVEHENTDILYKFVEKVLQYEEDVDVRKIKICTSKSQGYWNTHCKTYTQSMDNLFIPCEIKKNINITIDKFIENKQRYIDFGRTYKLGFLLAGVPGSGKTSLVKAIAQKYNKKLYILSFTKSLTDETLIELFKDITDNSILLIEDIDAYFIDRDASKDINISFSSLINCLDGALSASNGLLIFLTANNPERLDPALVRPGRVDMIIKFDHPAKKEIAKAFYKLTELNSKDNKDKFDEFYDLIKSSKIPMSGIIDYLFRHTHDYIESIEELIYQTNMYNLIVNDTTDKLYS